MPDAKGPDSGRVAILQAVHEQCVGSVTTPWTQEQWHGAFVSLFYTDVTVHLHDDLVFLVERGSTTTATERQKFRVVRKVPGSALPEQLTQGSSLWPSIAWQDTVLLNLVVQGHYELTVTTCSQELLPMVASGEDVSSAAVCITKTVYASPSRTEVNLASGKAHSEPQPSYPDIHFAVENYDDVFESLVLHNPDDCFCVVLKALFPTQTGHAPSVLFSGYVVLQQIRTYLADKLAARSNALIPTLLRKLLAPSSQGPSGPALQWHSVCMRGPGGVGLADVAVCRVSASAARLQTDASEKGDSGNGALQGSKQGDSSSQSLQCALVSLSMPVGALARDILSGSVPQSNTG